MADSWLVDSACTSHLTLERSYFTKYTPTTGHFVKGLGNQPVLGGETEKLTSHVDGKTYPITLNNVLHVPNAPHNLILLGRVTSAKIQILVTDTHVKFRAPDQTVMALGTKISNLYPMDVKVLAKQDHTYSTKVKVNAHTWDEWHRILGHLNMASIKQLKTKGMVTSMEVDESVTVSDLWGPAQTTRIGGEKYFITFTDGKSC